jgi:hypothetical protein
LTYGGGKSAATNFTFCQMAAKVPPLILKILLFVMFCDFKGIDA